MASSYSIYVVTGNTDLDETVPLQGILSDTWIKYSDNVQIQYLSKNTQKLYHIRSIIASIKPDYVYLNSMFSKAFTIFPLIASKSIDTQVILSPRGMLKASAIQYKSLKKRSFIWLLKQLGFIKDVRFHATDIQEKKDIKTWFNTKEKRITQVNNFPTAQIPDYKPIIKQVGYTSLVYVSRVAEIKNLAFFLKLLKNQNNIELNIFGPSENQYWNDCLAIIKTLPHSVNVQYHGSIENQKVIKHIQDAHFFILPTLGENFGHAIFEAFAAGRPALISDQTPWRDLKTKNIGWDVALTNSSKWLKILHDLHNMDQDTYNMMSKSAWQFANEYIEQSDTLKRYKQLFS